LAAAFWPGPLTLVLPKRDTIPDLVTAGLPSAAIRVPAQPEICALLERLDFPLAAPSANPFGYVSPTRPDHVQQTLGDRIPAILDGGPCHHGLESTILDLREPSHPRLLRPGPVSRETLAGILQCDIDLGAPKSSSATAAQAAPGLLSQHYSPRARVRLLPHGFQDFQTLDELGAVKAALLLNTRPQADLALEADLYWMAESEDLAEIGQNLFAMLQKCDRMGYGILFTEEAVDKGLGQAINDRLRRAAAG